MPAEKKPAPGDSVIIHTDGGCQPNPGVGGWAAVLEYRGQTKEIFGGELESTNNRMELTAAVKALESLKRPCSIILYTDSEYVKNGITLWLPSWKKRGWRRKDGDIKNLELWKELDEQSSRHAISWRWLRGHAGHPQNERCDELAGAAIAALKEQTRYRA